MKKGDSTLFSFASVSCHLWTYTFYLISAIKQSYRFQWEQIGKPLIKHLIKACTATAPRRISLGLLTYLYNAKGSVSTVYFMTEILFSPIMWSKKFVDISLSYIADQAFVSLIPGKHKFLDILEKKSRIECT